MQNDTHQASSTVAPAHPDPQPSDAITSIQPSAETATNASHSAQGPALVADHGASSNLHAAPEANGASRSEVTGERALATDAAVSPRTLKRHREDHEKEKDGERLDREAKRQRVEKHGEAEMMSKNKKSRPQKGKARRAKLHDQIVKLRSQHVPKPQDLPFPVHVPQTFPQSEEEAMVSAPVLQKWWFELSEELRCAVDRIRHLVRVEPEAGMLLQLDNSLSRRARELMNRFQDRCYETKSEVVKVRDGLMALLGSAIDDIVFDRDLQLPNAHTVASIASSLDAHGKSLPLCSDCFWDINDRADQYHRGSRRGHAGRPEAWSSNGT